MTCRQMDIRAVGSRPYWLMIALVCIALLLPVTADASPATSPDTARDLAQETSLPTRSEDPDLRVVDATGTLTEQETQVINSVLNRLAGLDTETVVYIRDSSDAATSQPSFAEELRIGWGVESAVGARDGLVIVVSLNREDPTQSTIESSYGLNTFPIRHLTVDGYQHLVDTLALPAIQQGNLFDGVRDLSEFTLGTVIDRSGTLTARQLSTIDGDLRRLGELGLPTLVYLRTSENQPTGDQAFANELLGQWSSPDESVAAHQMALVVSIDQTSTSQSTIVYAAGDEAFPIRQMTEERYQAILDEEAVPVLQDGDAYISLAYAIRRAINLADYSPPEPAPLSDLQEMFQEPLTIVASVLVQLGVLLYVMVPALLERKLTLIPSPRSMTISMVISVVLAIVVGILGVLDHNPAAALAALGVFLLATVVLPLVRSGLIQIRDWMNGRSRSGTSGEDVAHVA